MNTVEPLGSLTISKANMAANLDADHGLLMAEAHMIALAPRLGRELAHDVVYWAVREARAENAPFLNSRLAQAMSDNGMDDPIATLDPLGYLGQAVDVGDGAVAQWRSGGSLKRRDRATARTVARPR